MAEERLESKFEICMRDVSKDEARMLTYIITHMLKDKSCIKDIYQMLTGDNDTNDVEVIDRPIDFILLDSLGYGHAASRILRYEGLKTERDLVKYVYTRGYAKGVYNLGPSVLANIAVYMNIRNIIPNNSDMSDVISHFMTGAKAAQTLEFANTKLRNYMNAQK